MVDHVHALFVYHYTMYLSIILTFPFQSVHNNSMPRDYILCLPQAVVEYLITILYLTQPLQHTNNRIPPFVKGWGCIHYTTHNTKEGVVCNSMFLKLSSKDPEVSMFVDHI